MTQQNTMNGTEAALARAALSIHELWAQWGIEGIEEVEGHGIGLRQSLAFIKAQLNRYSRLDKRVSQTQDDIQAVIDALDRQTEPANVRDWLDDLLTISGLPEIVF